MAWYVVCFTNVDYGICRIEFNPANRAYLSNPRGHHPGCVSEISRFGFWNRHESQCLLGDLVLGVDLGDIVGFLLLRHTYGMLLSIIYRFVPCSQFKVLSLLIRQLMGNYFSWSTRFRFFLAKLWLRSASWSTRFQFFLAQMWLRSTSLTIRWHLIAFQMAVYQLQFHRSYLALLCSQFVCPCSALCKLYLVRCYLFLALRFAFTTVLVFPFCSLF